MLCCIEFELSGGRVVAFVVLSFFSTEANLSSFAAIGARFVELSCTPSWALKEDSISRFLWAVVSFSDFLMLSLVFIEDNNSISCLTFGSFLVFNESMNLPTSFWVEDGASLEVPDESEE